MVLLYFLVRVVGWLVFRPNLLSEVDLLCVPFAALIQHEGLDPN